MKSFLALAFIVLLTGCAVKKDWVPVGGSKADGVVRMSYEIAELETPILDEQQAIDLATKRCVSWGYTGAEAFGGSTSQCTLRGGFGNCGMRQVTKEYQCTGEQKKP